MSKVILITGSTDGIGKLAALKLAKDNHEILLHGRNPEKMDKVIEELKVASNNEKIKGFIADFSDLSKVSEMATDIKQQYNRIDVLINNAGVFKTKNPVTKDGLDLRYVVNYLAPYILTRDLLPELKNGRDPRVINLSSAAQASISLDGLAGKEKLSDQQAYAQSKLAILMWSFYLAKTESGLTTIALNPGSLLNTNMVREAYGKFWSSADKGADIIYDLAAKEVHKNGSGKYFDNDRGAYGEAHPDAYDESQIEQLIMFTEQILKS